MFGAVGGIIHVQMYNMILTSIHCLQNFLDMLNNPLATLLSQDS